MSDTSFTSKSDAEDQRDPGGIPSQVVVATSRPLQVVKFGVYIYIFWELIFFVYFEVENSPFPIVMTF